MIKIYDMQTKVVFCLSIDWCVIHAFIMCDVIALTQYYCRLIFSTLIIIYASASTPLHQHRCINTAASTPLHHASTSLHHFIMKDMTNYVILRFFEEIKNQLKFKKNKKCTTIVQSYQKSSRMIFVTKFTNFQ